MLVLASHCFMSVLPWWHVSVYFPFPLTFLLFVRWDVDNGLVERLCVFIANSACFSMGASRVRFVSNPWVLCLLESLLWAPQEEGPCMLAVSV